MVATIPFLLSLALVAHPLHISVTEIEYDEKDKALEIMTRIFIDDLEATLRDERNQPTLDILNPKGITLDQMLKEYLSKHFNILLDNKRAKMNYLGHEREGEALIAFIEVPNVRKWKKIDVMNDIIIETHEDQSNLVHITAYGMVKSMRLTKDQRRSSISFGK